MSQDPAPSLKTVTAWVDDHCTDDRSLPESLDHAESILYLHATCTPPCPRKQTIQWWIDINHPSPESLA